MTAAETSQMPMLMRMRRLLDPVLDDSEGRTILTFLEREFWFKLEDGESFVVRFADGMASYREGDVVAPDFMEVTLIETTREMLDDLLSGKIQPSDWLFSGRVYMSGMASAMAYNHAFLRLMRRGQELLAMGR